MKSHAAGKMRSTRLRAYERRDGSGPPATNASTNGRAIRKPDRAKKR